MPKMTTEMTPQVTPGGDTTAPPSGTSDASHDSTVRGHAEPVRHEAPRLACVLLTMGDRPCELARAIESVQRQVGEPIQVIVVANGIKAPKVPNGVEVVELPANAGVPGGRNAGISAANADVIMFLDDDGWLPDPHTAERLRKLFATQADLGIVSFRITDPDSGSVARRHVPRIRVGNPQESSDVTTFLGGATAIRRQVFEEVGVFPADFFYAHEETDLAWRALDAGWRIRYDAQCVLAHPASSPTRHPTYFRNNARNRVWLAKRHLPLPVAIVYLATWIVLTLCRTRNLSGLKAWCGGLIEGLRSPCGRRKPIAWRTVWRMTRLGRPPLV